MRALVCVLLQLVGCNGSGDEPIWADTKLADLLPVYEETARPKPSAATIDFNIFVFEMPAGATVVLDRVWPVLYAEPLHFNNAAAFSANLFCAGFGRQHTWDGIAALLREAGARKLRSVSLFLTSGQPNDVTVSNVYGRQAVYHLSSAGVRQRHQIGPGEVALRLRAGRVPASRGLCSLTVTPVFTPSASSAIPQLDARIKSGEVLFDSLGFTVRMSSGDFVFLGPKKYISHEAELAGRFFSGTHSRYPLQTFLIVCRTVAE